MEISQIFTILLATWVIETNGQWGDFFQGLQFGQNQGFTLAPLDFTTRKTTRKSSYTSTEQNRIRPKKKQTTQSLNFNSFFTTQKPVRKTIKTTSNKRIVTENNSYNSQNNVNYQTTKPNNYNKVSSNKNSFYDKNNDAIIFTTESSFFNHPGVKPANVDVNRPPITNKPKPVTQKPSHYTERPIYNRPTNEQSRPEYNTGSFNKPSRPDFNTDYEPTYPKPSRPNYDTDSSNFGQDRPSFNQDRPSFNQDRPSFNQDRPSFNQDRPTYTEKPNYNTNRPSYTERPSYTTERPSYNFNKPGSVKPTDGDGIAFVDTSDGPPLTAGIDEDSMSDAERRRYLTIAEQTCNRYKSMTTSHIQAIPLVPSPQPVQVNVSQCTPVNIPLVVGGKVVSIKEFPHMVLVGWNMIQGGYSWKCGGSLISEQFVLTAAHCAYQERDDTVVTGVPRVVQLGSSYLGDPRAVIVKVAAAIRHPKYKLPKSYYDIALLRLASTVKFTDTIRPACLGPPPRTGTKVIATGWGKTSTAGSLSLSLRSVSLPVWESGECGRVLGTSRKLPRGVDPRSQLCAGDARGGKDTCQGDSGGPLQLQEDCTWRVVGVTSLGRSCGAPDTPGLYATIQIPFIAAHAFKSQPTNTQYQANLNTNNDRNDRRTIESTHVGFNEEKRNKYDADENRDTDLVDSGYTNERGNYGRNFDSDQSVYSGRNNYDTGRYNNDERYNNNGRYNNDERYNNDGRYNDNGGEQDRFNNGNERQDRYNVYNTNPYQEIRDRNVYWT